MKREIAARTQIHYELEADILQKMITVWWERKVRIPWKIVLRRIFHAVNIHGFIFSANVIHSQRKIIQKTGIMPCVWNVL
jgi:hypothetical protein